MIRDRARAIRGVIFDLDGTLTVPVLDFDAMRREIGIAAGPILEALEAMTESDRLRAMQVIERHESDAAARSELSTGAAELLDFIRDAGLKSAVVTRNSRASTDRFIARHGVRFDALVTREDARPKPSPEPLLLALRHLGLPRDEVLYVGDHEIDRLTGEAAGITTYIVLNHPEVKDSGPPEMRLESLADLIDIIRGTYVR